MKREDNKADDYSWVTDEMFDEELKNVMSQEFDMDRHTDAAGRLLSIGGVYEILSEHFNNNVLSNLEDQRESA